MEGCYVSTYILILDGQPAIRVDVYLLHILQITALFCLDFVSLENSELPLCRNVAASCGEQEIA